MALIPILGTPSSYKVPGGYAEIVFAQGPASASASRRSVIFVMPKSSTGTWTANTVYRVRNEGEAKSGAGPGSPLHRAIRKFLLGNRTAKVYALPYAESTGGAPAAADMTITIAGTPTATGVWEADICGVTVSASYTTSDTATTLGAAAEAAINAQEHLPVTAANVAGVVTLTAKINGKSQGDGTTGVIRVRSRITSGTGMTSTDEAAALGLGTGTSGADGTTTEATNLAAALAVIDAARYYYVATSTWHAAEVGSVKTHVATKSEPRQGLRSVFCAGYTGTLATGQTLATGLNYERGQIAWQPNSEHDPAELVGAVLAVRQKYEEQDPAWNFDSYRAADWGVLPAYAEADWPDSDDQNDAINDGLMPIGSDQSGAYLVYSATTRSKNAAGSVDDPRALETHRVSCADQFADEALSFYALNFGGFKLVDDELLGDGSVNTNQSLPAKTTTPHRFKAWLRDLYAEHVSRGIMQDAAAANDSLRCVRDPNNGGRLEVGMDLEAVDLLHQLTVRFAEVSTG